MNLLMQMASALLLTIAVEFAAYLMLTGKIRSPASLLLCAAAVNMLTNPLLNYLYIFEFQNLILLESSAVLAESFLIMAILKLSYPQSIALSAAANLASLIVGIISMPVLLKMLQGII